jgi:hypothetical protein
MIDKVFAISGNKISSFIIDENSLKFSSKTSILLPHFKMLGTKTIFCDKGRGKV